VLEIRFPVVAKVLATAALYEKLTTAIPNFSFFFLGGGGKTWGT
jgi:hypothetical protein